MRLFLSSTQSKKSMTRRILACRKKFRGITVIVMILFGPLPILAEEAGPDLTLREAVEKSLQSHPGLAAFEYRLDSAEAYAQQAGIGEKAQINLIMEDVLGTGAFNAIDNAESTLSISWVLQGGLLEQRVKSAQSMTNIVAIERDIQRYDIAAQTAHAFLTILAFQERLAVAAKAREQAMQILNEIQSRVDAGRSPLADKLQAEVTLERRDLSIEDIEHELKSAKRVLASQWGSSEPYIFSLDGALTLDADLIDYRELKNGISSTPAMRYFLTQQRVIDSEIALAREEVKNRFRFSAGVRRYEFTEDYGATLGVSVPFGRSTRNQSQISALNAEQAGFRADARAKEVEVATQLYVLYEGLKHNYHLDEALTVEILPRLERALAETQSAYELGKYSYREWYALQNEVLAVRMEMIDVRLQAHSNHVEIERLTGLSLVQPTSTQAVIDNAAFNDREWNNSRENQ